MTPEQRETLKDEIRTAFDKVSAKIVNAEEIGNSIRQGIVRGLDASELKAYQRDVGGVRTAQMNDMDDSTDKTAAPEEMYMDGVNMYFSGGMIRDTFLKTAQYTELTPETNRKIRSIVIDALTGAEDHRDELKTGKLKPFSSFID